MTYHARAPTDLIDPAKFVDRRPPIWREPSEPPTKKTSVLYAKVPSFTTALASGLEPCGRRVLCYP